MTDAVAEIVPAVDSMTHYLEQNNADMHTVPAIRNLLAINFVLLFFFTPCFLGAAFIDLFREPSRACDNMVLITERTKLPINQFFARVAPSILLCLVTLYFDILGIATPGVSGGVTAAIYGYVVMFGGG